MTKRSGKRKRVLCFGHGPLHAGPDYQCGWEDVWLRWKGSDRRVHRAGPCLSSLDDLKSEIWLNESSSKKHPDLDWSEDIAYGRSMLDAVETDDEGIAWDDYPCPNIYTRATSINRREAERMLASFLLGKHGIKRPKFVWMRPKVFVMPFSVPAPADFK